MSNMGGENMCKHVESNNIDKPNKKTNNNKNYLYSLANNWVNYNNHINKHPITTNRKEELK